MSYRCAPSTHRIGTERGPARAVFASFVLIASAATAGAQLPNPSFFPIGVHSQPIDSFDKWKGRGINSLFQYEKSWSNHTMDQWDAAAEARGLYYARWPSANPANDLQKKNLMAWTQLDEPDLPNHNPNPAANIDIYNNLKAISPTKPVWVNFAGPLVTPSNSKYTEWVKAGDWIAADWYPVNWGRPADLGFVGLATDRLRASSNGVPKKFFSYIETSYQWINTTGGRAPTTGEFRAEVWNAINHGASGIVYFSQVVGRAFQYDGTPQEIVDEMTVQNGKMTRLGKILNNAWNPSTRGVTTSNNKLETSWRSTVDGDYFFVLNMSNTTVDGATISLAGLPAGITLLDVFDEGRTETLTGNQLVDSFAPYELHVYRTSTAGALSLNPVTGSPIPEPGTVGLLATVAGAGLMRRSRR
ncbi:MAG: beta-galactosidase [Phycisphaerae bacterium]|nr:beta-galactosidase [Tepidisphaeraceae bacterium]